MPKPEKPQALTLEALNEKVEALERKVKKLSKQLSTTARVASIAASRTRRYG
jgi:hypothetical protein